MQQSVQRILADLIDHIKEEGLYDWSDAEPLPELPYSKLTPDYYDYDRGRFIGELGGSYRDGISVYDEDLQTLLTQIVQMILFKNIVHHTKKGKNARTDILVKESRARIQNAI